MRYLAVSEIVNWPFFDAKRAFWHPQLAAQGLNQIPSTAFDFKATKHDFSLKTKKNLGAPCPALATKMPTAVENRQFPITV